MTSHSHAVGEERTMYRGGGEVGSPTLDAGNRGQMNHINSFKSNFIKFNISRLLNPKFIPIGKGSGLHFQP